MKGRRLGINRYDELIYSDLLCTYFMLIITIHIKTSPHILAGRFAHLVLYALYLRAVLIRYFLLFPYLYVCNNPCFQHLKKRGSQKSKINWFFKNILFLRLFTKKVVIPYIKISASTFSLVASLTSFCNALYLRAVLIRYFLLFPYLYVCNFLYLFTASSPLKKT